MSNKMKFWVFDSCKAKQIESHKKYQFQFTARCSPEKNNAEEIMRENRFASIVIVTWNSSYNNWIFCQSDGGVNWKGNSCQLLFQCIIIFFTLLQSISQYFSKLLQYFSAIIEKYCNIALVFCAIIEKYCNIAQYCALFLQYFSIIKKTCFEA